MCLPKPNRATANHYALRVEVEKPGSSDNVNVRIPLSFIRASAGLHVLLGTKRRAQLGGVGRAA